MRNAGLAAACLILMTACGGSDLEDRLAEACIKEGDGMTETQCRCVAEHSEEDLSPTAQAMLLADLENDEARQEELTKQLSMQDAAAVGTFFMSVASQCPVATEN